MISMNEQPTIENVPTIESPHKKMGDALLSAIRMISMEIGVTNLESVNDNGRVRVPTSGYDCSVARAQKLISLAQQRLEHTRSK